MKRFICLVADGFGVGEAPDAAEYGDVGANTLGHVAKAVGGLHLNALQKLGLGHLTPTQGVSASEPSQALVSRLRERSAGKDTTTGHWEIAGLVTRTPFPTYPAGFPEGLLQDFVREAGVPGILGNRAASGTAILEELGEEHLRSGKPIVYTSADSVFQIAAHEEKFGLKRLYQICEVARRLTLPLQVGRVIARPFLGESAKSFSRTENRRDYSLAPGKNCLDLLAERNLPVYSVGKIEDIFAHRSIYKGNHTGNNRDSYRVTEEFLRETTGKPAFIFANLVDFDMLYGHRRDPRGYARAIAELDQALDRLLPLLTADDCLMITSDHGCDPTFRGTDHTREFVPLVAYQPGKCGRVLADRSSFSDIAATILDGFEISPALLPDAGTSFLCDFKS